MDINCDLGEGFGCEAAILPFINSANIACGLHAGSPAEMANTVELAKKLSVHVGAHPSWNDRANFGRKAQQMPPAEIKALISYQLGALDAICRQADYPMVHVKPHGALYNQAGTDPVIAMAIIDAIQTFNPSLHLFALSNSILAKLGRAAGLLVKEEAFADRRYTSNGQLAPRSFANSVLKNTDDVLKQVDLLVRSQQVYTIENTALKLHADTICIHGDGPTAIELAKAVHQYLQASPQL
ncbi:5-oxoprolinase subunit PxpA [Flavihumibacter sp. UBA7668]|uniref:5-oxoprolinase subunit PxpA n=1 Tax=Flavihumibacter sp. UBA7668 TaxID=1946542 RepID=UPI0025B8F7E1|nr:5-oxoprolinase subunit PxpA [Flavihumibacter sp. UBA7668]